MKLHVVAVGLAAGTVWGMYVLLATIWLIWFREGASISALTHLYPGYGSTYPGALVGLCWGFLDGFIVGAAFAWLYNFFQRRHSGSVSSRQ